MTGPVTVVIGQAPITVVIGPPAITITGNLTMPTLVPFSFQATANNQTVFGPLPVVPNAIACLGIAGALQDQAATPPDFTVNGLYITLSQGVPIGTFVYGVETI